MPTSTYDGRGWAYNRLADSKAETVIDVGAGEGTYSILARHLIWWAEWYAVEVHFPYVERFMLGEKYDHVVVTDIRYWRPELTNYLVIFGDVIEHLKYEDALDVLKFHLDRADEIMVSVPIVDSPQGEVQGNPHEAHLHQWTFEEMESLLPGCESFRGVQVGRFWWRRNPEE